MGDKSIIDNELYYWLIQLYSNNLLIKITHLLVCIDKSIISYYNK